MTPTTLLDLLKLADARHAARSGEARQLRIDANLSQAEVGAVCEVTPDAVSRWESGSRSPRGAPAVRYAQLLEALRAARR